MKHKKTKTLFIVLDKDTIVEEIIPHLPKRKKAKISTEGLFVNFDAGFDNENLRRITASEGIIVNICQSKRNKKSLSEAEHYFDKKLYKERYTIERSNAWMDSFRSVLNCFDTTVSSCISFNYLAFIVLGLRKFRQNKKSR